jgi:hypothetical protein
MKVYGGVDVYLHSFLTYMEVSGQPHDLAALPPGKKAFGTADI